MSGEDTCQCKIGRVAQEYGVNTLTAELVRRRSEEHTSLRDLADIVNVRIVEGVLDDSTADIIVDPRSIYYSLTDDETDTEQRVRVSDQLSRLAIDIEALTNDFVSYQTVRRHLQNCLEMSTDREGIETINEAKAVIDWSRNRHENIVERTIKRLDRLGELSIEQPRVTATITIACERCGSITRIDELLQQGRCGCTQSS